MADAEPAAGALPGWLAVALVAGTSAAVLVLEILAGRLLAPYVGVSLETYTAIIGTVLAGIALGAAAGGWAADRVDPRRLVPALLAVGGALSMASIPIVRLLGGDAGPGGDVGMPSVILAGAGFVPATGVLSAVPPAVVKLQLRDLGATGVTVGRLSAFGTAGAIAGTFLAGFVLVAYAAVTTLIVTVGAVLVAAGLAMWLAGQRTDERAMLTAGGLVVASALGLVTVDAPCDLQTGYYCVSIVGDPDRATGRVLVLDDLRHGYVDLEDPTRREFWYVRRITDAIDAYAPAGELAAVSIGGGALTVPRWLRATRPGSEQVVLEIDPDLIELVERELGFDRGDDVTIATGDARLAIRDLPADSADVAVGDAFGSRAVPWHLATREFVEQVDRVLRRGGIYVVNVIDERGERFLRAQAATIREVLPYVAVIRGPSLVADAAGNAVIVASDAPLDPSDWERLRLLAADDGELVADIAEYLDGALVLTDDFAPVDQLLAGAR